MALGFLKGGIFYLVVMLIIAVIILVIGSGILYNINKSDCKQSDAHIQKAHKWASWTVALSATATAITLIGLIATFFV